jgi:hypothetical protein
VNGWGNNPATLGAVATAAAAVAILFAWLSLRESKAQRRSLEAEVSARMRPSVGLFDFGFQRGKEGEPQLRVLLRNFGSLPAQQARLKLTVEPLEVDDDEQLNPIILEEHGDKALMPMEEGNYIVDMTPHPRLKEWIGAGRDVIVKGTFEYALAGKKLQSQFQGILLFSQNWSHDVPTTTKWRKLPSQFQPTRWFKRNQSPDGPVPTSWKNISAILRLAASSGRPQLTVSLASSLCTRPPRYPSGGATFSLTIERQEGRWRSLTQVSRSMRVGSGRLRSLRLLHFAAAPWRPL